MEKDFYKILAVDKSATQEQISKAYRKLVKKYHPDTNPNNDEIVEKFKEVVEAYEVLGDKAKRAQYDQFGTVNRRSRNQSPPQQTPFNDVFFQHFFNSAFQQTQRNPNRGNHINLQLEITLEEAAKGCKKKIVYSIKEFCEKCMGSGAKTTTSCDKCNGSGSYTVQQTPWSIRTACEQCGGRGSIVKEKCVECGGSGTTNPKKYEVEVQIPSGIDNGMQIRMQGLGELGRKGQLRGDLFVTVVIKKHDFFIRNESTLFLEVPVSYTQLVLGGEITVPTLEGVNTIKIVKGTQNGTKLRIKGQGMPDINSGLVGDLIVIVQLEVPKGMDKDYLALMEDLSRIEKDHPSAAIQKYKDKLKNPDGQSK